MATDVGRGSSLLPHVWLTLNNYPECTQTLLCPLASNLGKVKRRDGRTGSSHNLRRRRASRPLASRSVAAARRSSRLNSATDSRLRSCEKQIWRDGPTTQSMSYQSDKWNKHGSMAPTRPRTSERIPAVPRACMTILWQHVWDLWHLYVLNKNVLTPTGSR